MNRFNRLTACLFRRKVRPPTFRTSPLVLIAFIVILVLFNANVSPSQAKSGSAYDLIAAVNQLRQANGLPPYQTNGSLMAAAQAHSDYQASIGSITHTGAGGSNAKSRAIAAGFGGGAAVGVSENIAGGGGMTYQAAVQMWQGDSLHMNTMLGGNYTDVGAGVAVSGNSVYFTLDVGYISGAEGSGSASSSSSSSSSGSVQPTTIPYQPVVTSTPSADGSVTHTVLSGQTLWVISALYKVALPEILDLNNFSDSTLIFPGDQILIQPASLTSTPSPTETETPNTPTATKRPTVTASPTAGAASTEITNKENQALAASSSSTNTESSASFDPALILIAGFVAVGTLLIILGNLIKRKS